MSSFTSYGELYDGRCLPTVCAPGATVISSSNEYYLEEANASDSDLQAILEGSDRRYSWHQCVGTSMSTPLVSGAIALWLEADPTLRANDVKDIIAKTAVVDDDVNTSGNSIQWGAGKFDAYAGLKEVLRRSAGIDGVAIDSAKRPLVTVSDARQVEIYAPGYTAIDADIFSIQGARVAAAHSTSDTAVIDCTALSQGVYVLNINGTFTQKIIIR